MAPPLSQRERERALFGYRVIVCELQPPCMKWLTTFSTLYLITFPVWIIGCLRNQMIFSDMIKRSSHHFKAIRTLNFKASYLALLILLALKETHGLQTKIYQEISVLCNSSNELKKSFFWESDKELLPSYLILLKFSFLK